MELSKKARKKLKSLGILLEKNRKGYTLVKPRSAGGNTLPGWEFSVSVSGRDILTDCPSLELREEPDHFLLECWETTPGPGPGDFRIEIADEAEVVRFARDYFFRNNPFFRERKIDEQNRRSSIHLGEIREIMNHLLEKLEATFSDNEIEFQTRTFHSIPLEDWPILKFVSEHPTIQVNTGFLSHEAYRLRRAVSEKREFSSEQVRWVADLLMELSLKIRKTEPQEGERSQ